MKENVKLRALTKIVWLIAILLLITILILNCFFKIKVYIFNISPNFISYILFLIIIISPMILFDCDKAENIWMKVVYTILTILIIPISIFVYMFSFSEYKYFDFNSPEKSRTLVIEEKSFLLSGESDFYERKFGIFIKSLEQGIGTDDGFRPFSNDSYKINWSNEDTVELEYDSGNYSNII